MAVVAPIPLKDTFSIPQREVKVGDKVPADMRLVQLNASSIRVEQQLGAVWSIGLSGDENGGETG